MAFVELKGNERVRRYLLELPKKLDKNLSQGNENYMENLKRISKMHAPRKTGELAESIKLDKTKTKGKTKQWKLVVDSPYGLFQETGYKPHFVTALTPSKNSSGTVGEAYNIAGFLWVSKFTPFVSVAFDESASTLDLEIKNAITKATQ